MGRIAVIVSLLSLLAVAVLVLAATPGAHAAGVEQTVCLDPTDQGNPDVDGDRIVWADHRNGNWDIYMKDLFTGLETPICTAVGDQTAPAIWGDRIVWEDTRNGNYDIYMYDVIAATETAICTASSDQGSPAIFGDRIVWEDTRSGNYDIRMYNCLTATETAVCTASGNQQHPAIWGLRITWQDDRNGNSDIYMYDLATATETPICTNLANQYYPNIWWDRIVWEDTRSGNWGIYMHDLVTATETPICTQAAYLGSPAICGDRIVWEDSRNGNLDIYMYDLDPSFGERQITNYAGDEEDPDIFGHRIVWADAGRGQGGPDVVMYDLATSTETWICSQWMEQINPHIWGDRVVWDDDRNPHWDVYMCYVVNPLFLSETRITDNLNTYDYYQCAIWSDRIVYMRQQTPQGIYMYDLAAAVQTPICTAAGTQSQPAVSGERIVWTDDRNGNSDIYMYDLATATETPICTAAGTQNYPAIDGDRIVWQDNRNGNYDVYMYDLATATETPVCTASGNQQYPDISGDRVVWTDSRPGAPGIYMYDLAAQAETAICTSAGGPAWARIDGDRIVWVDYRNGNVDIYMYKLAMFQPHDFSVTATADPTTVASGGTSDLTADYSDELGHGVAWWSWNDGGAGGSFSPSATVQNPTYTAPLNFGTSDITVTLTVIAECDGPSPVMDSDSATLTVQPEPVVFGDVPPSHPFRRFIEALYREGITGGCSADPLNYCPANNVTRGQMAVFVCKAAGQVPLNSPTPRFTDVPQSHPFYGWIERLADPDSWHGTAPTGGCTPTQYCPANQVTRGQMAAFLCKAAGQFWLDKPTPTFSDVSTSHPFYGYVERLADAPSWPGGVAVTTGCGAGQYCPTSSVTRGQMAAFLCRAFGIPY